MLNNALILDESTELVVVTNANFQNNNEKQQMLITPPQQTKNKGKPESSSNFITDQDVGPPRSNKKSSTSSSSRNYSYISSGADNSWMEKDPFEVSYSRSIEYSSVNKKGTKKGNIAPGGELRTIEDYISLGVPRDIAEMKHPLENAWTFWYYRNDKTCSWEEK